MTVVAQTGICPKTATDHDDDAHAMGCPDVAVHDPQIVNAHVETVVDRTASGKTTDGGVHGHSGRRNQNATVGGEPAS